MRREKQQARPLSEMTRQAAPLSVHSVGFARNVREPGELRGDMDARRPNGQGGARRPGNFASVPAFLADPPMRVRSSPILLQKKLAIGRVDDPLEQEADRVADQVMRMPDPAVSVASAPPQLSRKCAACEEEEGQILRKAADTSTSGVAPAIVNEVLSEPGQPLDPSARAYFEPRFGRDFSDVRVHVDDRSGLAATSVGALAFTVGKSMVFGPRQYTPHTTAGRQLLAHELTHIVQQSGGVETRLSRQLALAEPPAAEPMPRAPSLRVIPGGASGPRGASGEAFPMPESGSPRYSPLPDDDSFDANWERARRAPDKESAIAEAERPAATLARGGAPPDFITVEKRQRLDTSSELAGNFTIWFQPHAFHLLDALERDIGAVSTADGLVAIYAAYFPDSVFRFGGSRVASQANRNVTPYKIQRDQGLIYEPKVIDPDASARLPIFLNGLRVQAAKNPSIREDQLIQSILTELLRHEAATEASERQKEEKTRGPCRAEEVKRRGGNKAHNDLADRITGGNMDYKITTPGGLSCITDGRSSMNPLIVWEVKTRHEWATSYGIMGSIFAPRVQQAILGTEEQKNRCLLVTTRCGFSYRYAFESKEAADFMKKLWSGVPPVVEA